MITTGVIAAVMLTARPIRPVAITNHESGFAKRKHQGGRSKQSEDRGNLHPFGAQQNANYLVRKQWASNCDRNGCGQEQRVAPKEGSGKAIGVVLDGGEARDRNDTQG